MQEVGGLGRDDVHLCLLWGVGKWREERPRRIGWSFFFKYLKTLQITFLWI